MKSQAGEDYKLLAVDDEPIVHGMVGTIIDESGLPVRLAGAASSGEEALRVAHDVRPDICLLDINMSPMDGLELGRRLTETLGYKPRIVYLTAHGQFEYAKQAIGIGALEYILKPIRRQELIEALGKAINSLQAERIDMLERQKLADYAEAIVPGDKPTDESRTSAVARAIRKYIEERYSDRISIVTAADSLHLSSVYAGSLFKKSSGVSFRTYLRAVRVAKAKELMRDPRFNLSEIAEAVGYSDLNYFSQAFLAETGVRPSEYRGSGRRWAK